MNYEVFTIREFDKQLKRLIKKYPSIKSEIHQLAETLKTDPKQGNSLKYGCYKIRFAIKSKRKGKRGGARVITHVHVVGKSVYLLTIYDKSEKETIADGELMELLSKME